MVTVLCKIAHAIAKSLRRSTDFISRFGGEEFIVLLPETDADEAFHIAEKIRMNVSELELKYDQLDTGIVTISIGIESLKGSELNKNTLLKNSDIALYAAKDSGRNCSRIYGK